MHIIIDGYNLIRHSAALKRFEKQSLEAARRALAHRIALYRTRRDHRVTIVFDGREGDSPEEERDLMDGVVVIYSRRGETADDLIKRMVVKAKEETVVVTSDRNLADYVTRHGSAAVPSDEFEARLDMARQSPIAAEWDEDSSAEEKFFKGAKKKGPARRPSRREKTARKRIEKL